MIYMRNITITTAKSATYLENVGLSTVIITIIFSAFIGITYGFSMDLFAMLIPDMMKGIGFNYVETGGIASIARIGFLLASLLAGFAAPRIGAGRTIIVAVLLSVLAQMGMGFSQSVWAVYACAFVLGLCSSLVYVPMVAVVTNTIPFEHRAKVFGIISSGQSYGNFSVGMAIPVLLPIAGWRSIWLVVAGVSATIAVLSVVYLWRNGVIERRVTPADGSSTRAEGSASKPKVKFAALLNPQSIMIWLIMLFSGVVTYPFQTYISPYIQDELGLSVNLAGNLWSIIGFVGMWGGFVMGFIADRYGIRTALIICYVAMLFAAILMFFHLDTYSLMAAAALFGLAYFSMYGLFPSYISKSFDALSATTVFGVANVLLGLSTTIGSFLGGLAKTSFGTFGPVYLSIAAISIILILLTAFLKREGADEATVSVDDAMPVPAK